MKKRVEWLTTDDLSTSDARVEPAKRQFPFECWRSQSWWQIASPMIYRLSRVQLCLSTLCIKYSLTSSLSSRCFTLPSRLFLNIPTTTACEQTIKSIFELDSNFSGKEFQVVNLHRRTRQKFLFLYWLSGIPFHLFLPSHLPLYLSLNQWNSSFLD